MTESQLIVRYLQGDETAIADLVERHAASSFRLALSILDDSAEAEDAAQEAWLKVLSQLDTYRCEASFQTWLYTITLNVCRARLRKRYRRRRLHDSLATVFQVRQQRMPHVEEDVLNKERQDQIFEAVQSLGENERLTIILRYYHEFPIAEVARVMQVSERTVYVRLRRAYEDLRSALESIAGVK